MREKKFEAGLNLRLKKADRDELEKVAGRLKLDESEIARRALRLGLRLFRDVNIPGSESEAR